MLLPPSVTNFWCALEPIPSPAHCSDEKTNVFLTAAEDDTGLSVDSSDEDSDGSDDGDVPILEEKRFVAYGGYGTRHRAASRFGSLIG